MFRKFGQAEDQVVELAPEDQQTLAKSASITTPEWTEQDRAELQAETREK